jgi:hypothetical protein
MAEGAGDLEQEGVALDQSNGTAVIDNGDNEGVGLGLEPRKDLAGRGRGIDRLCPFREDFNGRLTAAETPWCLWTLPENHFQKG